MFKEHLRTSEAGLSERRGAEEKMRSERPEENCGPSYTLGFDSKRKGKSQKSFEHRGAQSDLCFNQMLQLLS